MQESIFTRIIKGDIPSYKIYEDEKSYAFLDINPQLSGHTLVVPKTQVEFVWDLNDDDYRALMEAVKKVARQLRQVTGKKYVHAKVVGIDVPHAHVHLIPFDTAADLVSKRAVSAEPDHPALAVLAKKLMF